MTPIEEVRDLLAAATCDAQYRTVASRAYFSIYRIVVGVARLRGFEPAGAASDHGKLIVFLRGDQQALVVRVGIRLQQMRLIRNRADYDKVEFPKALAEEAARNVDQIIAWFAMLGISTD